MPNWVPYIVEKDAKGLSKVFNELLQSNFKNYSCKVIDWIFSKDSLPSPEEITQEWHQLANILTTDMCGE